MIFDPCASVALFHRDLFARVQVTLIADVTRATIAHERIFTFMAHTVESLGGVFEPEVPHSFSIRDVQIVSLQCGYVLRPWGALDDWREAVLAIPLAVEAIVKDIGMRVEAPIYYEMQRDSGPPDKKRRAHS